MTTATTNGHTNGKAAIVGNRDRKPPVLPINVDAIPDAIKLLDRCVNWSWKLNPQGNGGKGKWDKPPLNTRTGGPGSSTDPATWSRFDEAVAGQKAGRFVGLGSFSVHATADSILPAST